MAIIHFTEIAILLLIAIEFLTNRKGAGTMRNVTTAIEWLKKALMSNPDCEELSFWYDKANKSKKIL